MILPTFLSKATWILPLNSLKKHVFPSVFKNFLKLYKNASKQKRPVSCMDGRSKPDGQPMAFYTCDLGLHIWGFKPLCLRGGRKGRGAKCNAPKEKRIILKEKHCRAILLLVSHSTWCTDGCEGGRGQYFIVVHCQQFASQIKLSPLYSASTASSSGSLSWSHMAYFRVPLPDRVSL